jgi:hypothetical protein
MYLQCIFNISPAILDQVTGEDIRVLSITTGVTYLTLKNNVTDGVVK